MAQQGNPNQSTKTWELTPYEIQRKPQEVITDDTQIAISPRMLHSELMCPICLDMLNQTATTKECLHRFCNSCITTALRSGNKECPTCRKKLVSRRSLRPDPNFDALIAKIYPDRNAYEQMQENLIQKITISHNQAALSQSIEKGLTEQAANRNLKMKKSDIRAGKVTLATDNQSSSSQQPPLTQNENGMKESNGTLKRSTDSTKTSENLPNTSNGSRKRKISDSNNSSSKEKRPNKSTDIEAKKNVEAELRPHPDQLGGSKHVRKVSVISHATVAHVSRYLTLRILLEKQPENKGAFDLAKSEGDPEFTLFTKKDETYEKLDYDETLIKLKERDVGSKKDSREKLQIYYLNRDRA